MRKYVIVWILIIALLGFEYWALAYSPSSSLLGRAQASGLVSSDYSFTVQPGKTLSLWLGWAGLSLMVIMNIYSLRKRNQWMSRIGSLNAFLNFHIFCGLLGPTFVFFHCGLKARGIVGISFWSMVVSLSSGIIGKYFFTQLGAKQAELEKYASRALERLDKKLEEWKIQIESQAKAQLLAQSEHFVGAVAAGHEGQLVLTLVSTLLGDARLLLSDISIPKKWPAMAKDYLYAYAMNKRKARSIEVYQRLMGYWHAFHFPFAIFMYIAAAIHIAASMFFLGMLK